MLDAHEKGGHLTKSNIAPQGRETPLYRIAAKSMPLTDPPCGGHNYLDLGDFSPLGDDLTSKSPREEEKFFL